jgi:hypothetical protein
MAVSFIGEGNRNTREVYLIHSVIMRTIHFQLWYYFFMKYIVEYNNLIDHI